MKRSRITLLACIVLLGFLVIGGLIGSVLRVFYEIRYTLQYILPYWLVGPFLFFGTILLIILFYQFAWPWCNRFLKKEVRNYQYKKIRKEEIPKNSRQAAIKSLESVDRLIERLQEDITTEGLRQEREKVEDELARGDLSVVVFGTGSSGKTSLIRALLNEIVGVVGAPMGSTLKSQTYRLRLKRLDRGIQIIDTPGILESGTDGFTREKEARFKASRSDLIIVVVDSDMRASELDALKSLSGLGKRLLLILNKCDLRGLQEEERLLALLRGHCKGIVENYDVIPASASPQSIPVPGKKPLQPKPEIEKLLSRLAKVLHEDGEEMIADNLLLQCRSLGKKGRELLNNQRGRAAKKCIDRYSWISSGIVAANPLPGIDLIATAAVNTQMVLEMARIYGIRLTQSRAQELATSVGKTLAGLGIVKGGVSIIGTALSLNLPAFLISRAIQGITAAWLTRVAGESFITYFKQDQDWGDGGIQEVVQIQYNLNKRESTLESFMEIAVRKVVEPLQRNYRRLAPRPRPLEEEEAWDHEHQE